MKNQQKKENSQNEIIGTGSRPWQKPVILIGLMACLSMAKACYIYWPYGLFIYGESLLFMN
jgi:hypothetical protein